MFEAAARRLSALDRKPARLQQLRSPASASVKLAREQRDQARRELLELVELADWPPEDMGSA